MKDSIFAEHFQSSECLIEMKEVVAVAVEEAMAAAAAAAVEEAAAAAAAVRLQAAARNGPIENRGQEQSSSVRRLPLKNPAHADSRQHILNHHPE